MPRPSLTVEGFWRQVDQSGGPDACWPWIGKRRVAGGYGRTYWQGRLWLTHRVAYALTYQGIPSGLHICHHCDNPICCNPAHLWAGTHRENILDAVQKGRVDIMPAVRSSTARRKGQPGPCQGERVGGAKLTETDVRAIRAAYTGSWGEMTALARQYGVACETIRAILRGRSWKSIKEV